MLSRTFQSVTHPDDMDADVEDYPRLLAGETTYYEMEKRYVHKEGHAVKLTWMGAWSEPVRRHFFIGRDLT